MTSNSAMQSLDSILEARQLEVLIDITPILDAFWTGIPVVAANISRKFLETSPARTKFVFEERLVANQAVASAIERNSGIYLANDFFSGRADAGPIDLRQSKNQIGFSPSVKRRRAYFDIEFSVVHDLSTLITPQYHTVPNIRHHTDSLAADLATNALSFCVSQATLDDVHVYCGLPYDRLALMYNGCSWPSDYAVRFDNEVGGGKVEPYFLILGTREPRKNILRIFDMLTRYPEVLASHRFVFAGKMGWLQEQLQIPAHIQEAIDRHAIMFTGFVSDYEKYKLLRAASASIYPSHFEGFGLPVLESLSVGTPCICSWTSSIPEVGEDAAIYFDPLSSEELYAAIRKFTDLTPDRLEERRAKGLATADKFTWDQSFASLETGIGGWLLANHDAYR